MRRRFADSPPLSSGLAGLATIIILFVTWPRGIVATPLAEFHLFIALIFVVMAAVDLLLHKSARQAGLALQAALTRPWRLDATLGNKLLATSVAAGAVWLLYQHAAIYQDDWYTRFTGPVRDYFALIFAGLLAYVVLVDRLMIEREDDLARAGAWLRGLGRNSGREGQGGGIGGFRNVMLATLIKAFFLPLMYCFALDDWMFFYTNAISLGSFTEVYEFLYRMAFFVDVLFAVIGYGIASRLLNSHVRWPEQTLGGWLVCIICYTPFWQIVGRSYFDFGSEVVWGNVFMRDSPLYIAWGSVILGLMAVYMLSTVAFGNRFSNLTYRGTLWRGPYALTRHPAYISKNLTMWMINLPFIATSFDEAMGNVIALLGVNALYFARARYEERCCRQAADYRLYERIVRRYGIIGRLRRLLRRFRPRHPGRSDVPLRRAR